MTRLSRKHIVLKYGKHFIDLPITPPLHSPTVLNPSSLKTIVKVEEYINKAIDVPIQSKPFNDTFRKHSRVLILLSDITRYTASELYLPIIIDRLNQNGIVDKNITILCALGIHRNQTAQEHKKILGANLHKRFDPLR